MVPKMRIQYRFFVLVSVIFLLIAGSFAFSWAAETKLTTGEAIRRDVEQEALQDAMNAFKAHDYEKAKIGFEMLSEMAKNPDISRQALFGLASVKLLQANSADEYDDAVAVWKKWSREVKLWKGSENPKMITPFLLRLQSSIRGGPALDAKLKDVDSKGILLIKEKTVQTLRSKLEMAEREILRLRHELESLDAIHRKYEEKKQEVSP
jgi:hypothetical protein